MDLGAAAGRFLSSSVVTRLLTVIQPGVVDYDDALAFQRSAVAEYARNPRDEGVLILLEHPPIITIGRSGTDENILVSKEALERAGVGVTETNRGGDVTYHGPGQVVGYPILPLGFHGKDVHAYMRRLESMIMATLWEYGIQATRREGLTGVWTASGKIASIGIAVSHWIVYHGFALNVAPNLEHFKLIHPCGLVGVEVTSMQKLLGHAPGRAEVEQRLIAHFCAEFGFGRTRVLHQLATAEAAT
jgi:lipoic acid synthetase